MWKRDSLNGDRGQAYTLEGFVSAMVVLMAVLFALQSVVITPTSGGLSDRSVQAQLQQEAKDALVVSDQDGNLSETIRNWNTDEDQFHKASVPGPDGNSTYNTTAFANQSRLGGILEQRFANNGYSYNVELVSETEAPNEFETTYLVYQGAPSPDAVTASYVVTLYEDDELTANERIKLENADDSTDYPISGTTETELVYNVVEVRVIVW
ncbi:DUF7288 family protein [Natrinema limicola]|uniref:Uncharacterized protein n=1 Tax=Natrinema limicola JCM 13563 TaxID=1230457 RepID=M0CQ05_9EURY|nr:hypothetical protein [Natrinema limicola]ELZ23949.1 hypothetical protein C476_04350 [Natrinema limicola JCM 13563]